MTRIMTISVSADYSGAPIVADTYIAALNSYEHVVVYGKSKINEFLFRDAVREYCIPTMTSSFSPSRFIISLRSLLKILRFESPDIVISHSAIAALLARALWPFFRYKLIIVNHGWPWRGYSRTAAWVIKVIEGIAYLFSRPYLVYLSHFEYERAPKFVRATSSAWVIPNALKVVDDYDPYAEKEARDAKNKSGEEGLAGAIGRVAMIARVDHSKDHELLINACRLTRRQMELLLVGEGTEAFSSTVDDNGFFVTGLGVRNDVYDLLSSVDVVALVSRFETLPMSLIEATRMGLPLVASDVGSVRSIVRDGYNGFLVTNDVSSVSEAIIELLDNPELRDIYGANSRQHYLDVFSFEVFSKRVRDLVMKIK